MIKHVLAVSVGGTKFQSALVDPGGPALSRASARFEWARDPAIEVTGLVRGVVEQSLDLVRAQGIGWNEVVSIAVAWPGPGRDGIFEATFIPGCDTRQPVAKMLREEFARQTGGVGTVPCVNVFLDALARGAGETQVGGGLHGAGQGLLINVATGIAGAVVAGGRVVLKHATLGEYYGQFGRYLFLDTASGRWSWRPTMDGSVPSHRASEVRWTRRSAGPALAQRVRRLCREQGRRQSAFPETDGEARSVETERLLLALVAEDAHSVPYGPVGAFADDVASEWAGAIRCLLAGLGLDRAVRVVLAGGVGEHLFLPPPGEPDGWLARVSAEIGRENVHITRSILGVEAELTGLSLLVRPLARRRDTP